MSHYLITIHEKFSIKVIFNNFFTTSQVEPMTTKEVLETEKAVKDVKVIMVFYL